MRSEPAEVIANIVLMSLLSKGFLSLTRVASGKNLNYNSNPEELQMADLELAILPMVICEK